MATRTRRKRTTPRRRRHSATRVRRQPKEPRSGSLRSTLDPRRATLPEEKPATDNPSKEPWWGSREQSGDLEEDETESNESVAELADEGQDLEAEELEGIEEARDPDQGALPRRKLPAQRPRAFKNRNRL